MPKRTVLTLLLLAVGTTAVADPCRVPEYGTVPEREHNPPVDACLLYYYNLCSGWVWYWTGYCDGALEENLPVRYGVVFDLTDCQEDCYSLVEIWWAVKSVTAYGRVDIEVFCVDAYGRPNGEARAALYGYVPNSADPWQHFGWGGLCITCVAPDPPWYSGCCVLITDWTAGVYTFPYSDHVGMNVAAACEDWRCTGHSFVYKNLIDYCLYYGRPAPLWVNGPDYGCTLDPWFNIPHGCHEYPYPTGTHVEFLMECYFACLGTTPTNDNSWSQIKAMYR